MANSDSPKRFEELVDSLDENGELPLAKRRWLREALKQRVVTDREYVWLSLEIISARKVQDIWEKQCPSEPSPIALLRLAQSYLISNENAEPLHKLLPEVRTTLDNTLALGSDYFRGVYSGYACWAAARNVVYGPPETANGLASELELDLEEWDACFFASLAYSGGAVWEEQIGDSDKRREFWTWLILEGVPLALSSTPHQ